MDWPTARQEAETIEAFAALGVRVNITELDVDVLPRYHAAEHGGRFGDVAPAAAESNPYTRGLAGGNAAGARQALCRIVREFSHNIAT